MEEVKTKKRFGKKATMWRCPEGEVTQTQLGKLVNIGMKEGVTISIGNVTYTKVSDGN